MSYWPWDRIAPAETDNWIIRDCPGCDGSGREDVFPSEATVCHYRNGTGEAEFACVPIECDDDLVDA